MTLLSFNRRRARIASLYGEKISRLLDVLVDDAELEARRRSWTPPPKKDDRGYRRLYEDRVLQASEGCDFDFLRGRSPVVQDPATYH
jgi:Dehydratase family